MPGAPWRASEELLPRGGLRPGRNLEPLLSCSAAAQEELLPNERFSLPTLLGPQRWQCICRSQETAFDSGRHRRCMHCRFSDLLCPVQTTTGTTGLRSKYRVYSQLYASVCNPLRKCPNLVRCCRQSTHGLFGGVLTSPHNPDVAGPPQPMEVVGIVHVEFGQCPAAFRISCTRVPGCTPAFRS